MRISSTGGRTASMGSRTALGATAGFSGARLSAMSLSKHFGGVRAVEDVSIDVARGEIVSVIGPNGAGKTSFLNMISGFYRPNSGEILLEQRDITRARPSEIARLGIA